MRAWPGVAVLLAVLAATLVAGPAAATVSFTVTKEFTDESGLPIQPNPGGTVYLRFAISNNSGFSASNLYFSDDISAIGSFVSASGCLTPTSTAGDVVSYESFVLPTGVCSFYVIVQLDEGLEPDTYTNTTSSLDIGSPPSSTLVAPATAELTVVAIEPPVITKAFDDSPAPFPGFTIDLDFTIKNTNSTYAFEAVSFSDNLSDALTGLVDAGSVPSYAGCDDNGDFDGAGTGLIEFDEIAIGPGETCNIRVRVTIPDDATPGTYLNITSSPVECSGYDGEECDEEYFGEDAEDELTVSADVVLTKWFGDLPPPDPGETVELNFVVQNPTTQEVVNISFTDDLPGGLTFVSLSETINCDNMDVSGTTTITVEDLDLDPGETCYLTVVVLVPSSAEDGRYQNVTSDLEYCIFGYDEGCILRSSDPAEDELTVGPIGSISFEKAFNPDEANAGDTIGLSFTITNETADFAALGVNFTDDLGALFPGVIINGLPQLVCNGGTLSESSPGVLSLTQAYIDVDGGSCSFSVELVLPGDLVTGNYDNETSPIEACFVSPLGFEPEAGAPGTVPPGTVPCSPETGPTAKATLRVSGVSPIGAGNITVVAQTTGGNGTFSYTGDLGAFSIITVSKTGDAPFTALATGTYVVSGTDPLPFGLIGLSCDDPDSGSSISFGTATAVIDLDDGEDIVCTFIYADIVDHTQNVIQSFINNRANTVSQSGPSTSHFMLRFCPTDTSNDPMNVLLQDCEQDDQAIDALNFFQFTALVGADIYVATETGATSADGDWSGWAEAIFSRYSADPSLGQIALFHAGIDYRVRPGMIVGFMGELDFAQESSVMPAYAVSGRGWMIGPYFAIRLDDDLFVDGKVLWGRSQNAISPFMTYTDFFSTQRWLATLRIAGHADRGAWQFRPAVEALYYSETQNAYVDSNGFVIPAQTVSFGQLAFGPEIGYRRLTEEGRVVEPTLRFEGIWTFAHSDPTANGIQGRIEGGINFVGQNGAKLEVVGGYEGFFNPGFSAWSVRAQFAAPIGD